MEKDELIRRMVHMCAPLFALLYLVPERIGVLPREILFIAAWSIFALFEIYRIKKRIPIIGLREYEYLRPSAAFWTVSALIPMILFVPVYHAIPLLLGFGFVDPLCGILRKQGSRMYPLLPALAYLMIMFSCLSIKHGISVIILAASITITIAAIVSEGYKNRVVDDDFLMLFVPMIVLWLFAETLI